MTIQDIGIVAGVGFGVISLILNILLVARQGREWRKLDLEYEKLEAEVRELRDKSAAEKRTIVVPSADEVQRLAVEPRIVEIAIGAHANEEANRRIALILGHRGARDAVLVVTFTEAEVEGRGILEIIEAAKQKLEEAATKELDDGGPKGLAPPEVSDRQPG